MTTTFEKSNKAVNKVKSSIEYIAKTSNTKQEAITAAKVDYDEFFVGRVVAPTVSIDTVRLLDIVSENVYEECGEHADDYLNGIESSVTKELDKKLNECA